MTPEEKEEIRKDLIGYVIGTIDEWLRLADFETSRESQAKQYQIYWEQPTDGAMIANVSERRYDEPVARFDVQITADTLPDLPPIGPENDLGTYGIDENCHGGADLCDNCAPLDAGASATRVDGTDERTACRDCGAGSEWVPATFGDLWPGDRVRIGTQEADVTKVSRGMWHARNRVWIDDAGRERDHQTPWEHEELNIDLTANPGMHDYDPGIACEILCTPERRAALLFQNAFPGTKPVDS